MTERWHAKPVDQFRGDGGAASRLAALDDRDGMFVPRQPRRGDEAVQSTTNDDDVGHQRSASTRSAALRPGAPMMPPPGCVADPHMYSRRTGVR